MSRAPVNRRDAACVSARTRCAPYPGSTDYPKGSGYACAFGGVSSLLSQDRDSRDRGPDEQRHRGQSHRERGQNRRGHHRNVGHGVRSCGGFVAFNGATPCPMSHTHITLGQPVVVPGSKGGLAACSPQWGVEHPPTEPCPSPESLGPGFVVQWNAEIEPESVTIGHEPQTIAAQKRRS